MAVRMSAGSGLWRSSNGRPSRRPAMRRSGHLVLVARRLSEGQQKNIQPGLVVYRCQDLADSLYPLDRGDDPLRFRDHMIRRGSRDLFALLGLGVVDECAELVGGGARFVALK